VKLDNEVKIGGNLTRDAELKYTNSGKAIARFSIAHNSSYKKGETWEEEVSFFDVTVLGASAEKAGGLTKGSRVNLSGKLKQERWEKDGKTNSRVVIIAFTVEVMPRTDKPNEAPPTTPNAPEPPHTDDFADDVPF